MRTRRTRRIHWKWIVALAAIVIVGIAIPSTKLRAAGDEWNYGRASAFASPYTLMKDDLRSGRVVTYSTVQRMVSGNRGYTTQIKATSSSRKDDEIATALEISKPQLYQLRFAVIMAQMAFEQDDGPVRKYIKERLPAQTQKRLIGPDFVQSVVYAVLHEFNPTKYPEPLIWSDYFPNLTTPFSREELDYFLAGSLTWDDKFLYRLQYPWNPLGYSIYRGQIYYSNTTENWKRINATGAGHDGDFSWYASPDCTLLDGANPFTAKALFDITIDKDFYYLKNSEFPFIWINTNTPFLSSFRSETLTLGPGNQPQYAIEVGFLGRNYAYFDGKTTPPYANPHTQVAVAGTGSYTYNLITTQGTRVTFRSMLEPTTKRTLRFGARPDWTAMGTAANPIPIYTSAELKSMLSSGAARHYRLMNHIDMKGGGIASAHFGGVFDGNGYAIANAVFTGGAGLFDTLSGTVKNLALRAPRTSNNQYAVTGAIATTLSATGLIENCYVYGATYDQNRATGGIVGKLEGGTVRGCTVEGSAIKGGEAVGGIVGAIDNGKGGTIEDCQVIGTTIETKGAAYDVGGIAGHVATVSNPTAQVTIARCFVDAATAIQGTRAAGGIVGGMVHGTIRDCAVEATIRATTAIGGIACGQGAAGASMTIARCRSAARLDATSAWSNKAFIGGIWATHAAGSPPVTIEDCAGEATYQLPTSSPELTVAGISATPGGGIAASRCVQTTPIVVTGAYPAHAAGIAVGGGSVDASVAACGTVAVKQGDADAIALPGVAFTGANNRYADTAVLVSGVSAPPSPLGAEVAGADVRGAAQYGAPYAYGTAWRIDAGQLPALQIAAATGAPSALRAAPTGTIAEYGSDDYAYARYELDGVPIDPARLTDGNGNPLVDGMTASVSEPLTVLYTPDAPLAPGDHFFRIHVFHSHEDGYVGLTTSGKEGWPDHFDGVGVRIKPQTQKTARLKVVQAGENFYARPDGGTCLIEEFAANDLGGTALNAWTLRPGVGLSEIALTPGRSYRLTDTTPPTGYEQHAPEYFFLDDDRKLDRCNAYGSLLSNTYIALQEDDDELLYVYTKHNDLVAGDTDDEVRNVTIEADTALYASVVGGTFDLYMYPDLTFTSTPRLLRTVAISRDAVQDPIALYPAYYKAVQKTAPSGHTLESAPIYFALGGTGGVLHTSSHALNPEMRGTMPSDPMIYLRAPSANDVRVHVRTLIVDDAYPTDLTAPVGGHAHIEAYDPTGDAPNGVRRNISMLTGFASLGIAYTDYTLPPTETAYPEYAITPIMPQYFTYLGHVVTTQDQPHSAASLTGTGPFARLDAASDDEFWVTFFIQPMSGPGDNALEWRTNEFGEMR